MPKKVLISGKVDLDTVGSAYLLGVTREDQVVVVKSGKAEPSDLADPNVVCIEVGGSGQIHLNNYDHHESGGPTRSAMWQTWEKLGKPAAVKRIVEYIDVLDTKGPQELEKFGAVRKGPEDESPRRFLSDVFAGILLLERDPVEQLHRGIQLLRDVVEKGLDPFVDEIPGYDTEVQAKAENARQVRIAVESARWEVSSKGLCVAILETQFPGATGALYGAGAEIVVLLNPNFNGVRKFTIGGNGVRVDAVLPKLNSLEPGWGGPATGTILGSPREGSKLSLKEVSRIVLETL